MIQDYGTSFLIYMWIRFCFSLITTESIIEESLTMLHKQWHLKASYYDKELPNAWPQGE